MTDHFSDAILKPTVLILPFNHLHRRVIDRLGWDFELFNNILAVWSVIGLRRSFWYDILDSRVTEDMYSPRHRIYTVLLRPIPAISAPHLTMPPTAEAPDINALIPSNPCSSSCCAC